MSSSGNTFSASIGKKAIMGLTGLFLITFLIIHCGINSLIFLNDGGETFNAAAHFMSHNYLIRVLEIGLFVGLILHIVQGIRLTFQNQKARPVKYAYTDGKANSKWYSRSMGVLGSLLLIFLVMHLGHFWAPTKGELYFGLEENARGTFGMLTDVFAWGTAIGTVSLIVYLVGVGSLLYHLLHGFNSAFQTMGWNHKKYTPTIKKIGVWYSVIICILFALMPIALYFGIIS